MFPVPETFPPRRLIIHSVTTDHYLISTLLLFGVPLALVTLLFFLNFIIIAFSFFFLSKALTFCARTHNFILHSSQSPFFLYFLLDKFQNRSGRQLNKYVVEPSAQPKLLFFLLSILFFLLNRARLLWRLNDPNQPSSVEKSRKYIYSEESVFHCVYRIR